MQLCAMCDVLDSDVHYLLKCDRFKNLRDRYLNVANYVNEVEECWTRLNNTLCTYNYYLYSNTRCIYVTQLLSKLTTDWRTPSWMKIMLYLYAIYYHNNLCIIYILHLCISVIQCPTSYYNARYTFVIAM